MRRALAVAWIVTLGYWVLRLTVLSFPSHCPDKIWESGPPECDYTALDGALFATVPVLLAVTCVVGIWSLARGLQRRRRLSRTRTGPGPAD